MHTRKPPGRTSTHLPLGQSLSVAQSPCAEPLLELELALLDVLDVVELPLLELAELADAKLPPVPPAEALTLVGAPPAPPVPTAAPPVPGVATKSAPQPARAAITRVAERTEAKRRMGFSVMGEERCRQLGGDRGSGA